MVFTTCFSGLPEDISLWNSLMLTRYIFIWGLLNCVSGQMAFQTMKRSRTMYLTRSGYRLWCRQILLRSLVPVLILIGIVVLLSLRISSDSVGQVLAAMVVFALNIVTLVYVQTLLVLLFKSGLGFVLLSLIQLFSIFLSYRVPGTWKLLLPGNWGMIIRSTVSTPDGYPLSAAVCIEGLLLLFLGTQGWRLVRWYEKKDGRI